jgi:hypothetical protein
MSIRHDLRHAFKGSLRDFAYKEPGDDFDELIHHVQLGVNIMGDWRYPFARERHIEAKQFREAL